jgi:hypothetical protein
MRAAADRPLSSGPTPSSFRAWMQLRAEVVPTAASLTGYVSALGPEWWASELKEAVSDLGDMFGPRKSIAGLANRSGGEVLLGVTNEGSVTGTPLSWEQIEAALHQPNATRSGAYVSDLTFAVRVPPVVVEVTPGARWAYVVEVVQQALPVYTWDQDHHKFDLFVRFAGGTRNLRAVEALDWLQEQTRARILRTICLEFDTVSRIAMHDQDYSVGFSPVMPYLQRCLEDGTLYTALSVDDRKQLLGEVLQGARSGGSVGFVGGLLRLGKIMETSRRILEQAHPEWTLQQVEDNLWSWHNNKWHELKQSREAFKAWLVGQGIRID